MPGTTRILIVDDEASIREVLGEMLASAGYVVETARDGDVAIRKLLAEDWHLLILDVMMPKVNGLEVIEAVRAKKPALKILILSAIGQYDANFFEVVLKDAVDARLEKPVKMETLLETVGRLVV